MILSKTVIYRTKEIAVSKLKPNSKIKILVKCDKCGKDFFSSMYQLTRNHHELCQECALNQVFAKDLRIGNKYNRLTVIDRSGVGKSLCQCECGSVGEYLNTSLVSGRTKSCGCLQKEVARKNILKAVRYGEEHHSWKGGITTPRQKYDGSKQKQEFCHQIIAEANNQCLICGGDNKLEVHHLYAFNLRPDLAFDKNNIVVLCNKCHKNFHSEYGLRTTPEMFEKYKLNH